MRYVAVALALALVACTKEKEPDAIAPTPTSSASATATPSATSSAAPTPTASFDAGAALAYLGDAGLNDRERTDLASILSNLDAPCPSVAVSIAQCLAEHRPCDDCGVAARYLAMGVRDGWPPQFLGKAYGARFDPDQRRDVPIGDSPTRGPASAPITIVEFGSYTCPHCAAEAPVIDTLMAAHPKGIRLVFKPMWTPDNVNSVNATRAAFAAAAQGKFWEMHSVIFADESKESTADLEATARSLGLDIGRFRDDAGSSETLNRMKRDIALAQALQIDNLPTLWINGRMLQPGEKLPERIAFELAYGTSGTSAASPAGGAAHLPPR
jgi:predicted DsbA family dithiol-disulfide isomerase